MKVVTAVRVSACFRRQEDESLVCLLALSVAENHASVGWPLRRSTRCPFHKYSASSCSPVSFPRKRESRRRALWGLDAHLRGHDFILAPDLRNSHLVSSQPAHLPRDYSPLNVAHAYLQPRRVCPLATGLLVCLLGCRRRLDAGRYKRENDSQSDHLSR
jgi:hypothetical protein